MGRLVAKPFDRSILNQPAPPKEKPFSLLDEIRRAAQGNPPGEDLRSWKPPADSPMRGLPIPDKFFYRDLVLGDDPAGGYLKAGDFQKTYFDVPYRDVASRVGIATLGASGISYAPVIERPMEAAWLPEDGSDLAGSDGTFGARLVSLRVVGGEITLGRTLAVATGNFAEALVRGEIEKAINKAKDQAIFAGSGQNGEPLGIADNPAVPVYTPSGAFARADAVAIKKALADQDVDPDGCYFLMATDVAQTLEGRERVLNSGRYILEDARMAGVPVVASPTIPAGTIQYGNFAQAAVTYDLGVLDLVIHPITPSGQIRIIAFRYIDVVLPRPTRLIKITGVS